MPSPLTSTLSVKSKSDSKSLESSASNKDSNITNKNQHLKGRSMSLSRSQGRSRTHATPDQFDLMRLSAEEQQNHDKRPQRSLSKTEVIIKDGPKGSCGKGKDDDDGFKCRAFCMCLPGVGNKAKKAFKARKRETKMDHHHHPVDPMMMSSTFSFEIFEGNSGIITNENNKEDESISSYFELPLSQMFKYNGDAAQAPVIAAFVLDNKNIKGEHL